MLHVRPYLPTDRDFLFRLAPRLLIGMPAWRDQHLWLRAVEGWLSGSIDQHNQNTMIFIAEDQHGEPLGFATVSRSKHFTGQPEASIGELATSEAAQGQGVGSVLVRACEQWAREQGYPILTLSTGAANLHALRFYHQLGFQDEDIKLIKQL